MTTQTLTPYITPFPAPMRAAPSVAFRNLSGIGSTTSFNTPIVTNYSIEYNITTGAGGFGATFNFAASAEL
ncbi:MAG: hypothetical protein WDN29_16390 [Methylovirgula sp.]